MNSTLAAALLGGFIALAIAAVVPNWPMWRRLLLLVALVGIYWSSLFLAVERITKAVA